MNRYTTNSNNSINKNKNKNNEREKPLYYNEYFISNNEENVKKFSFLFISLMTVFVFLPSISDIVYSYLYIDKCQEETYFITLNNWFRITGIFGIFSYFFIIILVYSLSNYSNQGYSRLINSDEITISESCESLYKIGGSILTICILIILCVGTYIFLSYFSTYCNSNFIIIYMWIRLLLGLATHIAMLFYINI